jgi:hypothetical protein
MQRTDIKADDPCFKIYSGEVEPMIVEDLEKVDGDVKGMLLTLRHGVGIQI